MLHLIWYIIVGFLAGCVAKALMHTHLSITWTVVLGIVGSIIGGCNTSVLPAKRWRPISSGRHNRFHSGSAFSPLPLA
jgi:uncharacterized membrane protein YeaQ/YmgE (transglycosylase-associated protein family)